MVFEKNKSQDAHANYRPAQTRMLQATAKEKKRGGEYDKDPE
jgi:hypothetical protein